MATTYKPLTDDDITSVRTLVYEAIPITGTVVSGTYDDAVAGTANNVKNYGHGMFSSIYDYPYLSSSANHIFDVTFAYSNNSGFSSSAVTQNAKKINIYNEMAKVLVGHDVTGSILEFDEDGDIIAGGTKLREVMFLNFSRLLYKDEIKKGSFQLIMNSGSWAAPNTAAGLTINDTGSLTSYRTNSPVKDYGILNTTNGRKVGLIYYKAGVAVLSGTFLSGSAGGYSELVENGGAAKLNPSAIFTGSISGSVGSFRHYVQNIQFNNTTELNSQVIFCRMGPNDFNYSSNPTYLSSSKIVVKTTTTDEPISYMTAIGLYSANNELLAVGKFSEPIKKTPSNGPTIKCRLDF